MDWTTRLNKVMDYVEASVHGEISEEEISKIAACPYSSELFLTDCGDSFFRICEKAAADHGGI